MSWTDGRTPDGAVFRADFLPDATLLASARPVRGQSVEAFVERMQELARASLRSFEETVLGSTIHVFGAVAVAVVACETLENGAEVNRNVEMMLLVKDAGRWRIAAQAWDKASANRPIPAELMGQR